MAVFIILNVQALKRVDSDWLSMFENHSVNDSSDIVPLCHYGYSCGVDFAIIIELECLFTHKFLNLPFITKHDNFPLTQSTRVM